MSWNKSVFFFSDTRGGVGRFYFRGTWISNKAPAMSHPFTRKVTAIYLLVVLVKDYHYRIMRSRSSVSRVHARAIFFRCNFLSFFPVPGWKRPWPDMRASGEARGTIIEPHKPHRTWPILSTRAPGKTNSPSPSASYWRLIRVSLQSSCPLAPFSAASSLPLFFCRLSQRLGSHGMTVCRCE